MVIRLRCTVLMNPETLAQLVGSGNTATIEEYWMRLVEETDLPLAELASYDIVLRELFRVGQSAQAEAMAWAALEAVSSQRSPEETLTIAGPFLRAVGESEELRSQVSGLYETVFGEREGFAALLAEAGLGGGRPVRRALRTLDVCLAVKEGDFLAARDDDGAARIDGIDFSAWQFSISASNGPTTLGAVHLADQYEPASATDFRVMRQFALDQLVQRIWDDPTSLVIEVCKLHGNRINSDDLRNVLVPGLISDIDWKKWWTKARAAAKRSSNVTVAGRAPYDLTYVDQPAPLADGLVEAFALARGPNEKVEVIEKYLRDGKERKEPPNRDELARCCEKLSKQARKSAAKNVTSAAVWWAAARRVAEHAGVNSTVEESTAFFKTLTKPRAVFVRLEGAALLSAACACLTDARPDTWRDDLLDAFPYLPSGALEPVARRLIESGCASADFRPVVERILSSPVKSFEALLWLWDRASDDDRVPVPPLVTLMSRIIRTLDDCRRDETMPSEQARQIGLRARAVLSARKFERFDRCLDELDPSMARALHAQISRLENLGRVVRDDLMTKLHRRFPPTSQEPVLQPWEREEIFYVTKESLARKQNEVEHLVNVKMRENAKAIGDAAERGDLSENSEYKFALEERDLLRARLAQMNSEVAAASVLSVEAVPTDYAGIGTEVALRRVSDGESYTICFVGPWEADGAKGRFNYKAPLAMKVLGKRVGDRAEFNHSGASGTYEIVALKNGLAPVE